MKFLLTNTITKRTLLAPTWGEVGHIIRDTALALTKAGIAHTASISYGWIVDNTGQPIVATVALINTLETKETK